MIYTGWIFKLQYLFLKSYSTSEKGEAQPIGGIKKSFVKKVDFQLDGKDEKILTESRLWVGHSWLEESAWAKFRNGNAGAEGGARTLMIFWEYENRKTWDCEGDLRPLKRAFQ